MRVEKSPFAKKNCFSIFHLNIFVLLISIFFVIAIGMAEKSIGADTQTAATEKKEDAKAADEIKLSSGDFQINVADESGEKMNGVTIMLFLPGKKDKSITQQPNAYYEIVDGGKYDQDKEKNGSVLLTKQMVSQSLGKKCGYILRISQEKYIPYENKGDCSPDKGNVINAVLKKYKSKGK